MNFNEFLAAARKAVENGDMEQAKTYTEQAQALKVVDDLYRCFPTLW